MPIWVWAINGILWSLSIGLVGLGVWKVIKARQSLMKAKWSEYSVMTQETIDSYKELIKDEKELKERVKELIRDYEKLGDIKGINREVSTLEDLYQSLNDKYKAIEDAYTEQIEYAKKGGISIEGFSNVRQIEATSKIAIAAALFALSSVSVGISAVLIAVFG